MDKIINGKSRNRRAIYYFCRYSKQANPTTSQAWQVSMLRTSNLCSEITLPTGIDKDGNDRTAVCCLSSLNLEKYEEWEESTKFY